MEDQKESNIELQDEDLSEIEEIFFNEDTQTWIKVSLDQEDYEIEE